MSDIRNVLAEVVADRVSFMGDSFMHLSTGREFNAEIEEIADIELNSELGRDPREMATLRIQDRTLATTFEIGQRVLGKFHGQSATFELVRRMDNPVSSQVEFGLRKIVEGVDS